MLDFEVSGKNIILFDPEVEIRSGRFIECCLGKVKLAVPLEIVAHQMFKDFCRGSAWKDILGIDDGYEESKVFCIMKLWLNHINMED